MWKRTLIAAPLLAAGAVAVWVGWLGWEAGYTTDADTGAVSGPYAWWQVAGCVVSLGVLAGVGGRFLNPLVVAPVVAVPFAVAWSVDAASADESGLWPVGAFLVLAGTAAGSAVVATATWLVRRRRVSAR
jgi:hypothetical protein